MKRIFTTILAVFYLTSCIGATVNLHYCMGKFVSFALTGEQTGKCGKCGMIYHSQNNDCCNDVKIVIKSSDQHLPGQISNDVLCSIARVSNTIQYTCNEPIIEQTTDPAVSVAHSPPFVDLPAFIRFHSFLI